MKTIRPEFLNPMELQTLLQTAIAPRPIALVSTINAQGEVNLSPFSFFNLFSTLPPVVIFSPSRRVRDNTTKHTLQNVLEVPEVVVGIVNFPIVQQVSLASTEYMRGTNEFLKSGLTMRPSEIVAPPLIQECPVNLECKVLEVKSLGSEGGAGQLVIAQIVRIHVDEKYLTDEGTLDPLSLDLVARLGGNYYSRQNAQNLFEVPKPLTTLGIGIDSLPTEVRESLVLTGNDLAMLANIEKLPAGKFSAEIQNHTLAKSALEKGQVELAWQHLQTSKH